MAEKDRRVKNLYATEDCLMDLIKQHSTSLPEDTYVVAVQYDLAMACFCFRVASSKYAEVLEGQVPPTISVSDSFNFRAVEELQVETASKMKADKRHAFVSDGTAADKCRVCGKLKLNESFHL